MSKLEVFNILDLKAKRREKKPDENDWGRHSKVQKSTTNRKEKTVNTSPKNPKEKVEFKAPQIE